MVYGGVGDVSACGYLRVFDHLDSCMTIRIFLCRMFGGSSEKFGLLALTAAFVGAWESMVMIHGSDNAVLVCPTHAAQFFQSVAFSIAFTKQDESRC